MEQRQWKGTTFGSRQMHQWLIGLLRIIDIRIIYVFTYVFVIPPCMFCPGFKPIYRYFRERWGMSPLRAFLKTYQNHCMFSQIVIDRFAIYAGKHFHIDCDGYEHILQLSEQPGAFVLLSSHIGNYEMAGYTLSSEKKPLNALVYRDEKPTIKEHRARLFTPANVHTLSVSDDMSQVFLIDSAIRRGEIVSMPADRMHGSGKSLRVTLLGAEASLPLGPFSVAAMWGLPALAVNVMKSGTRSYKIYVKPLTYDLQAPRRQQTAQLARGYADELERMLSLYPTQWYNFFDFWKS